MKNFYEKYGFNVVYDNGSIVYASNEKSIVIFNFTNQDYEFITGDVRYKFNSYEEVEKFFGKRYEMGKG